MNSLKAGNSLKMSQASQLDLVKNLETCYINGSLYSSIIVYSIKYKV